MRKLVLETGANVSAVDFPAGEGVAIGGFDGIVRATSETEHVPAGLSLWELSAGRSTTAKAVADFNKRLATPDGSPTSEAAYCAVSVRAWGDRRTFATDMNQVGRWREVRAYGVDDLETWLEHAPVTHAWLSEQLGHHPYGRKTPERWWADWAGATTPTLRVGLVLAGRTAEAADLIKRLSEEGAVTTISGPSQDDVLAFVTAALLSIAEGSDSDRIADRTLIVDEVASWRELSSGTRPMTLIAGSPSASAEAQHLANHHVVVPVTNLATADITLRRVEAVPAIDDLKAAGLTPDRAETAGRLARTSLQAVRRHLAINPGLHIAPWATGAVPRTTRGVLLAGRWNDNVAADQAALARVTGQTYEHLRESLVGLSQGGDPLITQIGQRWQVVAPLDSWLQLVPHIRSDDLARLAETVEKVLLEPDPAFGLSPEQRLRAMLDHQQRSHSADLRAGLARTLALLGTLGADGSAGSDHTGSEVAEQLVAGLLQAANNDDTGATWIGLAPQLQWLAEAGPEAFLGAVRDGLVSADPVIKKLFTDNGEQGGILGHESSHPELVWAIERIAWSTRYFGQAVDLMARVAEVDPGGRLGRRPLESIASILCSWHPDTSAGLKSRIDVLDGLRDRHQALAWQIMKGLVPSPGAIHMPSATPQFRDWKPAQLDVSAADVLGFIDAVVDRLLTDAGRDSFRWVELLSQIQIFSPDARQRMRDILTAKIGADEFDDRQRQELWESLMGLVRKHRDFEDAAWALPSDEIDAFAELATQAAPTQAVNRHAWLFQDYMPHLGDGERLENAGAYNSQLARARADAVREVDSEGGWEALVALVERATKAPEEIGIALARNEQIAYEEQLIALVNTDGPPLLAVAWGYIVERFSRAGWPWLEPVLDDLGDSEPRHRARLLLATFDHPTDWDKAASLGAGVAREYWLGFRITGLGERYLYLIETIRALLEVGRARSAAELIVMYSHNGAMATAALALTAADVLDAIIREPAELDLVGLDQYDLSVIFHLLESHSETVGVQRLGQLELAYLPALGPEATVPTLHESLASDPAFFVEALTIAYGKRTTARQPVSDGATGDDHEIEPQTRLAIRVYQLLTSWRAVPGQRDTGTIDSTKLALWLDQVIPLLREAGLVEVGEQHIGSCFASAMSEAGEAWPPLAVRDAFERIQSPRLEHAFASAVIGRRGATTRGLESGGAQERALVEKYLADADSLGDRWPRTAAVLRDIAETYAHFGRIHEADAEGWRRGMP